MTKRHLKHLNVVPTNQYGFRPLVPIFQAPSERQILHPSIPVTDEVQLVESCHNQNKRCPAHTLNLPEADVAVDGTRDHPRKRLKLSPSSAIRAYKSLTRERFRTLVLDVTHAPNDHTTPRAF